MMKKMRVIMCGVALAGVPTARAQSAFVYQYDGMNETNRVAVKSVKVSGPNRTLTWKADRDYPQCGVGFEFTATNWTTNNYVFAPAAIYDGNRFDIAYIRYAPYITNWEMPKKPNRPVVTTNIHHLNKNGMDARIDFLAGETSAPMVGYWDSVKKEGHLYLADPAPPLGETGFSVRESPKKGTCAFVISAPGVRTTKYTMCRSRREDCGDRYREIILPAPPTRKWADGKAEAFRDYFTTIAKAKTAFLSSVQKSNLPLIASAAGAVPTEDAITE